MERTDPEPVRQRRKRPTTTSVHPIAEQPAPILTPRTLFATPPASRDRDQENISGHGNLNFPAKIIRYTGIKTLPRVSTGMAVIRRNITDRLSPYRDGSSHFVSKIGTVYRVSPITTSTIELYNNGKRITAYLDHR